MNIFRRKLENQNNPELPIDPIDLYQELIHKPGFEYLRGIQEEVLREWHNRRGKKDVIIKMNTGSGKTLTGLLMLYSKLLELKEPCLFVSPDNQLLAQVVEQAESYGIPICTFDLNNSSNFPPDFLNSKKILVCNFSKLFNGKSIFERDHVEIGALVLDDAHTCVSKAIDASSLRVSDNKDIYKRLLDLFKDSLKHVNPARASNLIAGDPAASMRVPYWDWIDKHHNTINVIRDFLDEIFSLQFSWPLIAENLLSYNCFFSGTGALEITPMQVPYDKISSLNEAKHRFVLSATFENDNSLIKHLGISKESILDPIIPRDRKDIGERLILMPSRIDTRIDENSMRKLAAQHAKDGHNVVVLVPSQYHASKWSEFNAEIVDKRNIDEALEKLKNSFGNLMVFLRRYDGVDLAGDMCRVLVLDGPPSFRTIEENYIDSFLGPANLGKRGQTIEQGMGRAVRSGSDYSVVYMIGNDLVRYFSREKNLKYFTPVTRKQLKLGLNLLEKSKDNKFLKPVYDAANLCLSQDNDWRMFHKRELNDLSRDSLDDSKRNLIKITDSECRAIGAFRSRDYTNAANIIFEEILENLNLISNSSNKTMAWYLQYGAHLQYLANKVKSNDNQLKAYKTSTNAFYPPHGCEYSKISKPGKQAALVRKNIANFQRPQDLHIEAKRILEGLKYNPDIPAKKFERSLFDIGTFLGFATQMPENDIGEGPDVLFCSESLHFLVLEAKSRAIHPKISKDNIEQLLHSETWLKNLYGQNVLYTLVTLQPPQYKERRTSINENMKVIDQAALDLLHKNFLNFINALQSKQTNAHTDMEISNLLKQYSLSPQGFISTYLKKIKQ